MPSILLPELVALIASHLHQHDLSPLVRVNTEYRLAYTPHLWKTVNISGHSHATTFKTPATQQALHRYCHHIRTIRSRPPDMHFLALLHDIPALCNLTRFSFLPQYWYEQSVVSLVLVLKRNPCLQFLTIQSPTLQHGDGERLLLAVAESLPRLRELELSLAHDKVLRPNVVRTFLETLSSDLEILTLSVSFCGGMQTNPNFATLGKSVEGSRSHPKLRILNLSTRCDADKDLTIVPAVLLTFLQGCQNLESVDDDLITLKNYRSWIFAYQVILEVLLQRTTELTHLRQECNIPLGFNYNNPRRDTEMAQIISSLGKRNGIQEGWNILSLMTGQQPRPACGRALIKASKHGLRKLVLDGGAGISSQDIQSIFQHGRSLRVFRPYALPSLLASDCIRCPWSCTRLTILNLQITGIPRPDIQIDFMGQPIPTGSSTPPFHRGTMAESRALQRKVYAQLGSLICLRELTLGNDSFVSSLIVDDRGENGPVYFDPRFQSDCLEMSLASGIALLSGLQALQKLRVNNMDHRLGAEEVRWIDRTFPNLQILGGLRRTEWPGSSINQMRSNEMIPFGRPFGAGPAALQCNVGFKFE
ncbi:hypothetical protein BG015_008500 [Linnemannia schmuckeri]|uniref:F-box domain-containing protein n=1 Tax=Linnemannia schmuckeri TaxID=64567 RepID=A0A9P5S7J8_9FUNG|nr:hypothetical protein BG015_008500 [Linnemannia schmuckeri]